MRLSVRTGRRWGVSVGCLGLLVLGVGYALYGLVLGLYWLLRGLALGLWWLGLWVASHVRSA